MIHHGATIHPKAHVDPGNVTIGDGTKVWQFATVIQGTKLGRDCNVGAGAVLTGPQFGDRCKISSGVVMGPGFKIHDEVFIGPNVVLANDMYPFAVTAGYDEEELRSGERFAVVIGSGASIGANAVVLPGIRIGQDAIIAAGAVVDRHVPPGMIFHRNGYLSSVPIDWYTKRMRWVAGS